MTPLLLFHLYRAPINIQHALCDILSLVRLLEKILDQVDSQDSSLQSPFRCSPPFAGTHTLLGIHY